MHIFEQKLAASWPPESWRDRTILLAVSGGPDSVALLRGIDRLKIGGMGRLLVAHFNHALRGTEADGDGQFVGELAGKLGIGFEIGRSLRQITGSASEELLRAERYHFLQETAERAGAGYVVTAHTSNDQVETILHRILRGTGIAGLAGIPRTRPLGDAAVLIRPMLGISRQDVIDYLGSIEQPFREDATNLDVDYTRNRIRHELLPLLTRDYNANIADALMRLGRLAGDTQTMADRTIDGLIDSRVKTFSPTNVEVDCRHFHAQDHSLVRELLAAIWRRQSWPLADMGFREWDRLATIALAESPQSINLPGQIRVEKKGESLALTRLNVDES